MTSLSVWHWPIVPAVGLLLFGGRGPISDLVDDLAHWLRTPSALP
jgi:Sec-independent protein translocase protein TatA